jgi:nucleotide-binding universal stress UspA family protein
MYNKILVALDNSDDAKRAAEKAIEIAKDSNSEVVLFHSIKHSLRNVLPLVTIPVGLPATQMLGYDELKEAKIFEGKTLLDETKKMFERENIVTESRLIASENPEDYITRVVEEEGFDLVVLGCKGEHSFAKRVLMGTVPQIALNRASCDVLIVR